MTNPSSRIPTTTISADVDYVLDRTMIEYWQFRLFYLDHIIVTAAGLEGVVQTEPDIWESWVDTCTMMVSAVSQLLLQADTEAILT